MTAARNDPALKAAKDKIKEAIGAIDTKAQGAVADLCKLTDTLVKIREVEIKADEGTFGSGLGDA